MPPELRGDAAGGTSGRSWRHVGTQWEIRRDAVDGTSPRNWRHVIQDKEARDSGQLLHFGKKCCIFALSFIKNGTVIH